MGKKSGGGSAPAAPDPAATAAAQSKTNKETAYWNAVLNNVNQITPYGNLTYTQTGGGKQYNMDAYNQAMAAYNASLNQPAQQGGSSGYWDNYGNTWIQTGTGGSSGGGTRTPPKMEDFLTGDAPPSFTSTITLSPEQQAIYNAQTAQERQRLEMGGRMLGNVDATLSNPYSLSGLPDGFTAEDAATASRRGEEALLSRLDPRFAQDEEALRTRLINQGIGQGSEAYNREMQQFGQTKNDARMQAILQGANYGGTLQNQALQRRLQGIDEYNATRNAPLNEYLGLTSGVQVNNPQFQNKSYQGAAPVDYTSLVNQQYQAQLGQYNANQASRNNTQSALFGLGGQIAGSFLSNPSWLAALSDIRAKENIVKIGETPGGINVYEFNYIGQDKVETGVMAQEVEKVIPEAVITGDDGLKRVIYSMVK